MKIEIFDKAEGMSRRAADLFLERSTECVARAGRFLVCLSGGETPRRLYELLGKDPYRTKILWKSTHVFWGDERCLPLNHPDNHYAMATHLLLRHVPLPLENIHRIRGEALDPQEAADEYEKTLHRFFEGCSLPKTSFDFVLLGIGADGHTASLYPGTAGLREESRLAVAHYVPQRAGWRVTLTLPSLNASHHVAFLVTGREKAEAISRVVAKESQDLPPAALIAPPDGSTVLLLDEAAASLLPNKTQKHH